MHLALCYLSFWNRSCQSIYLCSSFLVACLPLFCSSSSLRLAAGGYLLLDTYSIRVGQKYKVILPKIQSEIQKRLLHIPTLILYQGVTSWPSTRNFFIDPTDALLTLDYPRSRSCSRLPHQTPNTLPLTFRCLFISLPFQSLRILHPPSSTAILNRPISKVKREVRRQMIAAPFCITVCITNSTYIDVETPLLI